MEYKKLKRVLGLKEATMIGLGATLGPGIFIIVGNASYMAGPAVIISYILGAISTYLCAFCYSELSAAIPTAGGGYTFTRRSLGVFPSFMTGWFMFFGNLVYSSFASLSFAVILRHLLCSLGYDYGNIGVIIVAVAALIFFSYMNYRGAKETGYAQDIITIFLIVILLGTVGYAIYHIYTNGSLLIKTISYEGFMPRGFWSILSALGYIYVQFIGFEIISTAAEEIKEPEKNIPRAIMITVTLSTILYISIAIIEMSVIHYTQLNTDVPLGDVAEKMLGALGVLIIDVAGIFASLSTLNAALIAASRVLLALSRDGFLPKFLSEVHEKWGTPSNAILVVLFFSASFVLSGSVNYVVYLSDFGYLVGLTFINYSVIALRNKRKLLWRPYRVPIYPIVPIAAAVFCAAIIFLLDIHAILSGIIFAVIGVVVYYMIIVGMERVSIMLGGASATIGVFLILVAVGLHSPFGITIVPNPVMRNIVTAFLSVAGFVNVLGGVIHLLVK
ncbi:hypothetical protein DRO02_05250 [archaeon]|nr:MAG: hypothetical protein DRO02_05250 [archaeon]RLG64877.1 MAG: hypothetical protein DRO21_03150 [archaeon]HDM23428.1 amino acid permease [Candidatus Bathyarchaeota archaeon]